MGYSREVYDAAMAELNRRRTRAEGEAQERRAAFYVFIIPWGRGKTNGGREKRKDEK